LERQNLKKSKFNPVIKEEPPEERDAIPFDGGVIAFKEASPNHKVTLAHDNQKHGSVPMLKMKKENIIFEKPKQVTIEDINNSNNEGTFVSKQSIPMELYHHPFKQPHFKKTRETTRIGDYSPQKLDELEALKRENLDLKKSIVALKNMVSKFPLKTKNDVATIERLYEENEHIKNENHKLVKDLQEANHQIHLLKLENDDQDPQQQFAADIKKKYTLEIEALDKQLDSEREKMGHLENEIYMKNKIIKDQEERIHNLIKNNNVIESMSISATPRKEQKMSKSGVNTPKKEILQKLVEEIGQKLKKTEEDNLHLEEKMQNIKKSKV
jgi:chromosome segregation ATPase